MVGRDVLGAPSRDCGETLVGRGVLDAPTRNCGETSVGRDVLGAPRETNSDGRQKWYNGDMAKNKTLSDAKKAKQDEFYTQYADIQTEMNAYLEYDPNVFRGKTVLLPCDDPEWSNFTRYFAENFAALGLKKLVSTSYAPASKTAKYGSLFEYAAAQNGERPQNERGKIFVLDRDVTGDGKINFEDLEWHYLEGDGDFRSEEVCRLRDEADIIVTNPPFSLFREFLAWILEGRGGLTCGGSGSPALPCGGTSVGRGVPDAPSKQFAIIGNRNAITYKEVFPLIKENKIWLDNPFVRGAGYFKSQPVSFARASQN